MKIKKPALFLDRDGVINIEKNYIYKVSDIEFMDGIFDLVRLAKKKNYLIFVITNQAGIGRGLYSEEDFFLLNNWMIEFFASQQASIDKVYYCPYHPEFGIGGYLRESSRRKPNPGMIIDACNDFNIDLSMSVLIGDKYSDIQAGISANVNKNILLCSSGKAKSLKEDDFSIIKNLNEAIEFL